VPWSERRALVIASGPSAQGIAGMEKPSCAVIAVNSAITGLPWNPDYWFSLDAGPRNMSLLREQREGVKYVYAVDCDVGHTARQPNQRQSFDGAWLLERRRGSSVSKDRRAIHHGNSGFGAMQLAVHLGARRIALAGVDGTQAGYWHGSGAPGNLKGVAKLFTDSLPFLTEHRIQVRVAAHPDSTMTMFEQMPLADLLEWVSEQRTAVGVWRP